MTPKLTIKFLFIVPTLNAGSNIEKFSQLLLDQDYQYWRVIFVDGASQAKDISSLNKIIKIDKRFSLVKESLIALENGSKNLIICGTENPNF